MTPRRARLGAPLALAALAMAAALPRQARAAGDAPPIGVGPIDKERLPQPGSYTLERIHRAPDGEVLTVHGTRRRLHALLRGQLSVVSFMYTYCRDPVGCPLALRTLAATHSALLAEPALARRAQLVSLSFDPTNDTPEAMARYGHAFLSEPRLRWQFLTTASVHRLLPLLEGFGQDVSVELDARGRPTRTLNHQLKVFLVDGALDVREIYGVETLDVAVLVNDLRTLSATTG
jgi:cytochrome oxidase Cu insertion factor (SCO1/SenC/PrrC family)